MEKQHDQWGTKGILLCSTVFLPAKIADPPFQGDQIFLGRNRSFVSLEPRLKTTPKCTASDDAFFARGSRGSMETNSGWIAPFLRFEGV